LKTVANLAINRSDYSTGLYSTSVAYFKTKTAARNHPNINRGTYVPACVPVTVWPMRQSRGLASCRGKAAYNLVDSKISNLNDINQSHIQSTRSLKLMREVKQALHRGTVTGESSLLHTCSASAAAQWQ